VIAFRADALSFFKQLLKPGAHLQAFFVSRDLMSRSLGEKNAVGSSTMRWYSFPRSFWGHRVDVTSRNVKDLPRREAELKTIDASAQSGYLSAIYYLTLSKPFYILDKRRLTS
jgi:hypothetical protein